MTTVIHFSPTSLCIGDLFVLLRRACRRRALGTSIARAFTLRTWAGAVIATTGTCGLLGSWHVVEVLLVLLQRIGPLSATRPLGGFALEISQPPGLGMDVSHLLVTFSVELRQLLAGGRFESLDKVGAHTFPSAVCLVTDSVASVNASSFVGCLVLVVELTERAGEAG